MDAKCCRICLDSEPLDDLFSPCKCTGSVKYVHRECLSTWVKTTHNPDSKRMCMMCHTEYLKSTPKIYGLFHLCTIINHNPVIIFCLNMASAAAITLIVLSFLVDDLSNNETLIYCAGAITVNLLLIFSELVYGFIILYHYKLKFTPVLPKVCQIMFSPTLLIIVGTPIISVTQEITVLILLGFMVLLCINIAVSALFASIDSQILSTHTADILPYPIVENEQKETFIEIGRESVLAINEIFISEEEWNRLGFQDGMVVNAECSAITPAPTEEEKIDV